MSAKKHNYRHLIQLFEQTFFAQYNTRLVKGESEPLYLPAGMGQDYAQIIFAHGFYASALHEIAHWCIAGEQRRRQEDYGYWYCPDGRDAKQQRAFEQVEVKPQAIEYAFCLAAGCQFRVSTDNLDGATPDTQGFSAAVSRQLQVYRQNGFPPRAQQFIDVLEQFYSAEKSTEHFQETRCIS